MANKEEIYRAALETLASHHAGCEDGWYACPQSEDYFGDYEETPIEERPCFCHNKIARQALEDAEK